MRFQFSKTTGLSFGASLMAIAAVGIMPSTASAQSNPDAECVLTEDQANPTLAGANATGEQLLWGRVLWRSIPIPALSETRPMLQA